MRQEQLVKNTRSSRDVVCFFSISCDELLQASFHNKKVNKQIESWREGANPILFFSSFPFFPFVYFSAVRTYSSLRTTDSGEHSPNVDLFSFSTHRFPSKVAVKSSEEAYCGNGCLLLNVELSLWACMPQLQCLLKDSSEPLFVRSSGNYFSSSPPRNQQTHTRISGGGSMVAACPTAARGHSQLTTLRRKTKRVIVKGAPL